MIVTVPALEHTSELFAERVLRISAAAIRGFLTVLVHLEHDRRTRPETTH
ncbi:hypothetical protein ACWGQ5_03240 [Streptomyces sp. NPDC055722]